MRLLTRGKNKRHVTEIIFSAGFGDTWHLQKIHATEKLTQDLIKKFWKKFLVGNNVQKIHFPLNPIFGTEQIFKKFKKSWIMIKDFKEFVYANFLEFTKNYKFVIFRFDQIRHLLMKWVKIDTEIQKSWEVGVGLDAHLFSRVHMGHNLLNLLIAHQKVQYLASFYGKYV